MKARYSILLVIALGALVYGNSLRNGFVWDDTDAIVENYFIRQWSNAPDLLTREYFVLSNELSYRPLVTLTYFVDYALWGLKPAGYHLGNVLLHLATALLLLALLRRLTRNPAASLAGALVFVAHPATTEAVNVVAFREDVMAGFCVLLAFVSYLLADRAAGLRRGLLYGVALLSYFVGLLAKEMAATLPLLLIAHDLLVRRPLTLRAFLKRAFTVYAGFFLVLAAYLLLRFDLMHNPKEATVAYFGGSFAVTMLTSVRIVASYVKLMVLPVGLSAEYIWAPSRSVFDTDVVLSLALIALCLAWAWRRRSDAPLVALAIVSFFVLLAPVANVIPIVNLAADRYLYLPTAAFGLLVAAEWQRRPAPRWALVGVLLVLGGLTAWRNTDWKDNETIWSRTARKYPDSADIHHELGDVHQSEGRLPAAVEEYQKALAINPGHVAVRVNLGVCYDALGRQDLALEQYQVAVRINPSISKIHNNLGNIYYKLGRLDDAVAAYGEALRLNPYYPQPYGNLATALTAAGRLDEAAATIRRGLDVAPDRPELKTSLARVHLLQGHAAAAEAIRREMAAQGQNTAELDQMLRQWQEHGGADAGAGPAAESPPPPTP